LGALDVAREPVQIIGGAREHILLAPRTAHLPLGPSRGAGASIDKAKAGTLCVLCLHPPVPGWRNW
ncbi:MAG: hypothetical protein ABIZ64_15435, partial [Casimicrobium sp.]